MLAPINFSHLPTCHPILHIKTGREDTTIQYPARLLETLEYSLPRYISIVQGSKEGPKKGQYVNHLRQNSNCVK